MKFGLIAIAMLLTGNAFGFSTYDCQATGVFESSAPKMLKIEERADMTTYQKFSAYIPTSAHAYGGEPIGRAFEEQNSHMIWLTVRDSPIFKIAHASEPESRFEYRGFSIVHGDWVHTHACRFDPGQ